MAKALFSGYIECNINELFAERVNSQSIDDALNLAREYSSLRGFEKPE
jgi:hypothetical protein